MSKRVEIEEFINQLNVPILNLGEKMSNNHYIDFVSADDMLERVSLMKGTDMYFRPFLCIKFDIRNLNSFINPLLPSLPFVLVDLIANYVSFPMKISKERNRNQVVTLIKRHNDPPYWRFNGYHSVLFHSSILYAHTNEWTQFANFIQGRIKYLPVHNCQGHTAYINLSSRAPILYSEEDKCMIF